MAGTGTMNKKIKARWLKALRSGKFPQGRMKLHAVIPTDNPHKFEHQYCCLGVLCELAKRSGVVTSQLIYDNGLHQTYRYDNPIPNSGDHSVSLLPKAVQEWAGLYRTFGDLGQLPDHESVDGFTSLASMNDKGLTFAQIADVIEERF